MHSFALPKHLLLVFILLPFTFLLKGQSVDSLEQVLSKNVHDTVKMSVLSELIQINWKEDLKKAIRFAKNNLFLAVRSKKDESIASASNLMAGTYYFMGDYKNALLYNIKTLQTRKKTKSDGTTVGTKKGIASSYINIAGLYLNMGNYTSAIENNLEALKLKHEIQDTIGEARVLANLANTYENIRNYDNAIEYNLKAMALSKAIKEDYITAACYNNLGNVYVQKEQFDKAFKAYTQAMEIRKSIDDEEGLYSTYNNLGELNFQLKDYVQARKYYELAWAYYSKSKDPYVRTSILANLGQLYRHTKDPVRAEKCLKEAVQIAQINKMPLIEKNAYESLAQMFASQKVYDKAYDYMSLYSHIIDTIFRVENSKRIAEMQAKYDDAFKTNQLASITKEKIASELENSKKELEIQKQTNIRNISLITIALMCIIGLLFYNRYALRNKLNHQLELQNKQIAEKNLDITNSINYAKRIQNAIVPSSKSVSMIFPQNFILYKPKDIVAGDFYWCETVVEKKFIAVADCTGHGVPGAMVSVVCSNALNRALFEFNLTEPGKLLDKTRELILETFSKNDERVNDGMDISLLCVDSKEALWSGAFNPLIYFTGGIMKEIKAHKQPIGKSDISTPFPTHRILLEAGTTFYLFSDGFADQFGGKEGKKLKYKNLLNLFRDCQTLSMPEQKQKLDQFFEEWSGDLEQIDDVCVVGIRI